MKDRNKKKKKKKGKKERKKKWVQEKTKIAQKYATDKNSRLPFCGTSYTREKRKALVVVVVARGVRPLSVAKKDHIRKKSDCRGEFADYTLYHRDRTDQDYKDPGEWQNVVVISSSVRISFVETFPIGPRPGAYLRSRGKCFPFKKKHRERERTTIERETYMYRTGDVWSENERQREERDRAQGGGGRGRKGNTLVWYMGADRGGGRSKETCDLMVALFLLALFAVVAAFFLFFFLSLFLYLVVPFPNFTLQIPLLTLTKVDAVVIHLANPLQLHYKEYGESLRNLWFFDIYLLVWQSDGPQAERGTDSSRMWSISRYKDYLANLACRGKMKLVEIDRIHVANLCRIKR